MKQETSREGMDPKGKELERIGSEMSSERFPFRHPFQLSFRSVCRVAVELQVVTSFLKAAWQILDDAGRAMLRSFGKRICVNCDNCDNMSKTVRTEKTKEELLQASSWKKLDSFHFLAACKH